ncbi:MAG: recombinase family protein [Bdellovibrionota bacterium]|nr:recombinase family protein [Bdellovibrionota bacterium]
MSSRRVALYARVSTDQQSSGLEAQVRALKEYCQQNNIHHYELYCDENQSGAKTSRPALDRMMKAVKDGQVSKVIVFAFSRFARSTTHLLNALNEFKQYGADFVSITEKIETNSPMGVAMFTILGALSQMERELISQRVRAGLANARAHGKTIGRKKTRPSELIRALLKQKMTFREIARIAGCSHGCISAEKKEMLREAQGKGASSSPPSPEKPKLTLV